MNTTTRQTQNLNVTGTRPLIVPRDLEREMPATQRACDTVIEGRETVERILDGNDPRMLVIVGPCSIHDVDAAMEYADKLATLRKQVQEQMVIIMRVYFEKPRTSTGWKGLINDPHLDDSFDMDFGLRLARKILLDMNELALPTATEMLEPITPQYIDDLVTWGAIGARTTESQTHRQMASGLSMPIGFKNSTEGNLQVVIDAMKSALSPHQFLGMDEEGRTCIVSTRGNRYGHMILRGGGVNGHGDGTNYRKPEVTAAAEKLTGAGLNPRVIVDCSHANSQKDPQRQPTVFQNILEQVIEGRQVGEPSPIVGAMLESHLFEGRQSIPENRADLKYGVSITDGCIGWEATREMLEKACEQLSKSPAA